MFGNYMQLKQYNETNVKTVLTAFYNLLREQPLGVKNDVVQE